MWMQLFTNELKIIVDTNENKNTRESLLVLLPCITAANFSHSSKRFGAMPEHYFPSIGRSVILL